MRRVRRAQVTPPVFGGGGPIWPDARVALREIETHPIDLLITDIRMPNMTGLELIIAARRLQETLPVIVMTAHPTADLGMEAILSSSIEYLQKPFELDRFIST